MHSVALTRPPRSCLAATDVALRAAVVDRLGVAAGALWHEMSLPTDRLRADVVAVGPDHLSGYELKSCADRLSRLPRQVLAYEEVFAYCHVVVGPGHLDKARLTVPPWWGIQAVSKDGSRLYTARKARAHQNLRPEVLVKLLWRDEAVAELTKLGIDVPAKAPRSELWGHLTTALPIRQLQKVVASVLARRRSVDARIDTRWSRTA